MTRPPLFKPSSFQLESQSQNTCVYDVGLGLRELVKWKDTCKIGFRALVDGGEFY